MCLALGTVSDITTGFAGTAGSGDITQRRRYGSHRHLVLVLLKKLLLMSVGLTISSMRRIGAKWQKSSI